MGTILNDVKKACGITEDYKILDDQIVMHTNTVLATLFQLGVGPASGFEITTDGGEQWTDFIESNPKLNMVKTYVGLRVRMLFDPPSSGTMTDALNRQIDELTWRINVMVDPAEME